jgi:hypothetical protein
VHTQRAGESTCSYSKLGVPTPFSIPRTTAAHVGAGSYGARSLELFDSRPDSCIRRVDLVAPSADASGLEELVRHLAAQVSTPSIASTCI